MGNSVTRPGRNGGTLNNGGNDGNKYGAGRKPDEWKQICAALASDDDVLETAKKVIRDPENGAWLGAFKFLAEQGYGKAKESIEHSGSLETHIIIADESKL